MKICKFGIGFHRITENDIELLRKWRNSPRIQQFMEYRKYITKEMQKKWFQSINNIHNFYYIIEYKNEKIGLINDKNIDWDSRTSESGFFIWDKKYYGTHIPIIISIAMIEVGFYVFDWDRTFVRILSSNDHAIRYCRQLGYILCEGQKKAASKLYVLTRESYELKAAKIKEMAVQIASPHPKEYLLIENEDYEREPFDLVSQLKSRLPPNLKSYTVSEGEIFYL